MPGILHERHNIEALQCAGARNHEQSCTSWIPQGHIGKVDMSKIQQDDSVIGRPYRPTALERQDLSRTYLAHHELESVIVIIITLSSHPL